MLTQVVGPGNVKGIWGPVMLAIWIAAIVGGYMTAWTRLGLVRWASASVATLLLLVLGVLLAAPLLMVA